MKKIKQLTIKQLTTKLLTIMLAVCMACGVFVGCDVAKYKVTVRLANPTIAVGGTTTALVAIAGTEDQDYVLSSSDTRIATVADDGVITGVASGTVDIIATAHADGKSTGKATLIVGSGIFDPGTMTGDVAITASIESGKSDRLSVVGDTTRVIASVTGADDKTYTYSVDPEYTNFIEIDSAGNVTVKNLPESRDILAKVTVTSNADTRKTASVSIRVEAPYIAGQVGDLTSAMIQEISNKSITFSGTITDVYDDLTSSNDVVDVYNTTVEMQEGKWKATWSIADLPNTNPMTVMYAANDDDVSISGEAGMITDHGKTISQVYIDKNNEVARKTITNYAGVPVLWENQCMYNQFKTLPINSFEESLGENVPYPGRTYHLKSSATNDLNMVRVAASLSPLFTMSDIFSAFYFVLNSEKTAIEKIIANTAITYDSGDATTATARWWLETELTISEIGTTVVADPEPYAAPTHVEELQAALTAMKGLDSYYFKAVDTTTRAPQGDPDDYELQSVVTVSAKAAGARAAGDPDVILYGNKTISSGDEGLSGWVTENAVMLEYVSKYTYSMDDNNTKYEYRGYAAFDGYYEKFDWVHGVDATETADAVPSHFRGIQRVEGNTMKADVLPGFDFSPNVFTYVATTTKGIVFRLQSDEIVADIAGKVSMHSNSRSAEASATTSMTITVKDGKIVETVYPYNSNSNYSGYVTTTYSRFDATVMPMLDRDGPERVDPITHEAAGTAPAVAWNDGYVHRVIPTSWSQLQTKHRHSNHSTLGTYDDVDAATSMIASWGEEKFNSLPSPKQFLFDVFGDVFDTNVWSDGVSGPFFNWNDKADGDYYDFYDFTCKIETGAYYPSEAQWDQIKNDMFEAVKNSGFSFDGGQSGKTSAYEAVGYRYLTFTNNTTNMVIQIENNYTNNLGISIFEVGAKTKTLVA